MIEPIKQGNKKFVEERNFTLIELLVVPARF